jgi:predicted porin
MGNYTVAGVLSGLTIAISSVALTAPAHAMGRAGHAKLYGSVDIAVQNKDIDTGATSADAWEVESYTSIIGIKGKEKLSHGLAAIYQYELEVDPEEDSINDSNDSNFLKAREQFIGLKGDFGTFRLGRMDTPLKKSQGKIDLFSNHAGDLSSTLVGEQRKGDQINYTTPTFADAITLQLALLQGEGDDIDGASSGDVEDGLGDAASFNAIYNAGGLFLSFGYDDGVAYSGASSNDTWQIAGGYAFDAFTFGAVIQGSEETNTKVESTGFLLSASYNMNDTVFKAQYADSETENSAGTTTMEESNVSLGVDHHYSKRTTVYAEFNQKTDEDPVANTEEETTIFGVGIRKKF